MLSVKVDREEEPDWTVMLLRASHVPWVQRKSLDGGVPRRKLSLASLEVELRGT